MLLDSLFLGVDFYWGSIGLTGVDVCSIGTLVYFVVAPKNTFPTKPIDWDFTSMLLFDVFSVDS